MEAIAVFRKGCHFIGNIYTFRAVDAGVYRLQTWRETVGERAGHRVTGTVPITSLTGVYYILDS